MRNLKQLLPIFVVFIWFTHYYGIPQKSRTEIDIWPDCDEVVVEPNLVDGTLNVTPIKDVFGWPVSHQDRMTTYHDVSFTTFKDSGCSAVYLNHLEKELKHWAPVDDVKLMHDPSQDKK